MAELGEGMRSGLHIVRTVRRSEYFGKETGGALGGGPVDPLAMTASSISVASTAFNVGVAFGPEAGVAMATVMGALIGVNAVSQYIVDGTLVIPNPAAPISAADQIQHTILQHVYGKALGDKLWNLDFGTRQTEIDLRSKWPG
jgi:hypothetical protein